MFHMTINKFIKIDKKTNITENNIIREPNSEEKSVGFNSRVYQFYLQTDLNLTNKDLRDKSCHYAIVSLHWNV